MARASLVDGPPTVYVMTLPSITILSKSAPRNSTGGLVSQVASFTKGTVELNRKYSDTKVDWTEY